MADKTTIVLRSETRDKLFQRKQSPDDTYDDVVTDLLNEEP